jgi:hypothetical protein
VLLLLLLKLLSLPLGQKVSWHQVWSILCALRSDSFNLHQVPTSGIATDLTLLKHFLMNPPFLHLTVPLETMTFATTLILLNNYFIVTAGSYEINSTFNKLNLEEAMNQHYRQIKGSKPTNDNDKELTLSAFGGMMCYHCKQAGHKAHECPKKANGGGGKFTHKGGQNKFQKKCDNCGWPGHKSTHCWEKEENQGKRPEWFNKNKSSSEVGATAQDSGKHVGFMLCGVTKFTFPQSQDLLLDPNIWIADLAATVHTTAHKQGFHTLTTAMDANSITVGNGIAEKAFLVGKLTGTMCKRMGWSSAWLHCQMWSIC